MSKKLEKVLEYLINNQEDKAKELLHQVFIEKARSIHEDLINMDEEGMDDMGDSLTDEAEHHSNHLEELGDSIESEETMEGEEDLDFLDAETDLGDEMSSDDDMDMGDDADMDMGDDADMMDMGDAAAPSATGDMSSIEDTMSDLEDALAKLKAEFEALESGKDSEDEEEGEEEEAEGEEEEDEGEEEEDEGEEEEAEEEAEDEEEEEEGEEEEMDESWLNEFDDLEESVELEKVSMPSNDEVGAGKYSKSEANTKSPTAKAPDSMFGAKPVQTGKGSVKSGYEREAAPSAAQLKGVKDNRRRKATDGQSSVSKEGNSSATLNKKIGAEGTKSPLSSSPRK